MSSLAQLLGDYDYDCVPVLTETNSPPLIPQGHMGVDYVDGMIDDINSVIFEWCEVHVDEDGK